MLTVVLVFRMAGLQAAAAPEVEPVALSIDEASVVARLSEAIRVGRVEVPAFAGGPVTADTLAGGSVLLTWEGSDTWLPPILLAVSLYPSDGAEPPQEAARLPSEGGPGPIEGGYAQGRGARSVAAPALALLEAMDLLLGEGFRPRRTVLVALTRDGSRSGAGAGAVAAHLARRGVRPVWALVGGSMVRTALMPGLSDPVAVVGTAERGRAVLRVSGPPSAGVPGSPGAAEPINQAVLRLEEERLPARLTGPTRDQLVTLGPHLDPGSRMLAANLWLLEGPVARALAERAELEPAVRTTFAALRSDASQGAEPSRPRATADLEVGIAPWNTLECVLASAREAVGDLGVEVSLSPDGGPPIPPSRESSAGSDGFALVRRAAFRTFPDIVEAVPGLVAAPTRGRAFEDVTDTVLRFVPLREEAETGSTMPETERVRVTGFLDAVRFYAGLVRDGAG